MTAYLYRPSSNNVELLAFTFLDTLDRTFAHREVSLAQAGRWFTERNHHWKLEGVPEPEFGMIVSADSLLWKPWTLMR